MTLLAMLSGIGLASAVLLIASGIWPAARSSDDGFLRRSWTTAKARLSRIDGRKVGLAALGALVAILVVRWPVAAVAGAAGGWFAPLPGERAQRRLLEAKTEAIAQWCEMLRDTAGTARGIEGMLVATARSAPGPIRKDVMRMADRLQHEPLDAALDGLAEDLAHPIGDMVVVALRLAATAGSRRVAAVLDQLATAANRTATMRRRVEVARARPRSAVRLVAVIIGCFVTGLLLFAGDYVEPYSTPLGQLVLVGIAGYWALGFWWMTKLGRVPEPPRFLTRAGSQRIEVAR